MNRITRIGASFGWLVGGVLALALLGYAILLAINWRDRPPSAAAVQLMQVSQNRQDVPDERNAYVFMLGFAADPNSAPLVAGRQRKEWISEALQEPEIDYSKDPLASSLDFRAGRDAGVASLSDACGTIDAECLAALNAGDDVIRDWLVSERLLLDKYEGLIALDAFLETMPYDVRAPLLSYSLILDGQKLLFAQSRMLAGREDAEQVRALLGQDLGFWRMVLAEADTLLTKMIAVAAIRRHFSMGTLIIRRFPPELTASAVPASWHAPISDAERSMRRTLAGDWLFVETMLKSPNQAAANPRRCWRGSTKILHGRRSCGRSPDHSGNHSI